MVLGDEGITELCRAVEDRNMRLLWSWPLMPRQRVDDVQNDCNCDVHTYIHT